MSATLPPPTPTPRVRTGRIVKPDPKRPATIVPASEADQREDGFNPQLYAETLLQAYWLNGSKKYFLHQNNPARGEAAWLELGPDEMKEELLAFGLLEKPAPGETISQIQSVMRYIRNNRTIEITLSLAGWDTGVYIMNNQKVLIRTSAEWIDPKPGDWSTLDAIFQGLFCRTIDAGTMPSQFLGYLDPYLTRDRGRIRAMEIWRQLVKPSETNEEEWIMDQSDIFFSWLKLRLEVYTSGRKRGHALLRNAQMLTIAGPANAGKGLLQNLILTPIFGGRIGDPAGVLFGKTDFNKDLFAAELLSMEEMPASTKSVDRKQFAEQLKNFLTRIYQRFHPKGKDGVMLSPIWTMVSSLNDDDDSLRAFPPITNDLADKLHLLHVSMCQMPMPTTTHTEYTAFAEQISKELPAFLDWLMHTYEIPKCLLGGRFGMLAFHAPELVKALFDDTPAGNLLDLIDTSRFSSVPSDTTVWTEGIDDRKLPALNLCRKTHPTLKNIPEAELKNYLWVGQAHELSTLLEKEDNSQHRSARDLFKYSTPARLLKRLAIEVPHRVRPGRTGKQRLWFITAPPSETEAKPAPAAEPF